MSFWNNSHQKLFDFIFCVFENLFVWVSDYKPHIEFSSLFLQVCLMPSVSADEQSFSLRILGPSRSGWAEHTAGWIWEVSPSLDCSKLQPVVSTFVLYLTRNGVVQVAGTQLCTRKMQSWFYTWNLLLVLQHSQHKFVLFLWTGQDGVVTAGWWLWVAVSWWKIFAICSDFEQSYKLVKRWHSSTQESDLLLFCWIWKWMFVLLKQNYGKEWVTSLKV